MYEFDEKELDEFVQCLVASLEDGDVEIIILALW
jgi:hypothetical protein